MEQFAVIQEQQPETRGEMFSLRDIGQVLRRRVWPVSAIFLGILLATAAAFLLMPLEYEAVGSIALDRRPDQLVDSKSDPKPLTTDSSSVETEVQVLKSPSVAAAVVDGLGLSEVPGFGVPEEADAAAQPSRDRAIRSVQHSLDAKRAGTSYAIWVQFDARDPVLAARAVNAAMNAYTGGQRSTNSRQLARDAALLKDRIDVIRGELMRTEAAVAQYRARTGLIDLAANSDAANQGMQSLNTQLAQARADEAAARAKVRGSSSITSVASSSTSSSLRGEVARLEAKRAELSQRYSNDYPELISVNEQVQALRQSLAAEEARVRQGVAAEAMIAANRAASLRGSVNQQQSQLMKANATSVQLAELERNSDAAKTLYSSLLDQYKQKVALQGTEQSKSYIVAYAAPPTSPASPNPIAFLIGGLIAAIVGAALAASVLENLERGLLNQTMAEHELALPVLAAVPDLRTVKDAPLQDPTPGMISDHILSYPEGVFPESLRSIRTALNLGQEGQVGKCIAVTSALPDEGKTATTVCLARSTALAGSRVLLIDCDLRRHGTTDVFAPRAGAGLIEVLRKEAQLEHVTIRDAGSGLDVLPAGASANPDVDLLTSGAMRALLVRLRDSYDVILLETPPVLPVAETRALAAMADATVLIVRWRTTPVDAARKALDLLRRAKANVVGAVLTRVSLTWTAVGSLGDDAYYYTSYAAKAAT